MEYDVVLNLYVNEPPDIPIVSPCGQITKSDARDTAPYLSSYKPPVNGFTVLASAVLPWE